MGVRVVFRWSALFRVASVLDAVAVVVQKCVPWDTKHSQIGSIPSITTKHRSDRRAADPSTIVARLSLFRLPWLQYPPASGFCLQLGASFGCFVVLQSPVSPSRPTIPPLGSFADGSVRFEPVSGGVIRSRSPDSVLRPTASCKAQSAPDTRAAAGSTGELTWCQQIALTPV